MTSFTIKLNEEVICTGEIDMDQPLVLSVMMDGKTLFQRDLPRELAYSKMPKISPAQQDEPGELFGFPVVEVDKKAATPDVKFGRPGTIRLKIKNPYL